MKKNARRLGGTINLPTGETGEYYDNLFFTPDCDKYKLVVESVVFADEEEWTNPYFYEWLVVNAKLFTE